MGVVPRNLGDFEQKSEKIFRIDLGDQKQNRRGCPLPFSV